MTSTNWLDLLNEAKQNGGNQDFGPIPVGDYHFKIVEATPGQTKTEKTKYTIKAQIQAGPHANRIVWDDLIVTPDSPAAMGFFFRKMQAIGLGQDFFQTQPTDDQIAQALTGREFLGRTKIDNFGGKDRTKIDMYKALSQAQPGGFIPPQPGQASAAPAAPQQAPYQAPPAAPVPQAAPPAPAAPQAAPPAPGGNPWDNQGAPAAPPAAPGGNPWDNGPAAPPAAPGAPNFPTPPF